MAATRTTLKDRIDWIREVLGIPGEPLSEREFCRRADLSHTFLTMLMKRLNEDPNANLDTDSLMKIARMARVPAEWLASGDVPSRIAPQDDEVLAAAMRVREHKLLTGRGRKPGGPPDPDDEN